MELFNNLMKLCEENEAFYFADQDIEINGITYTIRSFTYRLASYQDFIGNTRLQARESRGTAFYSQKGANIWELFCRAYPKFWNLGEGIETKEFIKNHNPVKSFEKMDGSLILFGMIDGQVIAKSKTSINSEQAQMAQKMIMENKDLYNKVIEDLEDGFTPVFELVGPDNVIVLRYDENKLVLLGLVNNKTGAVYAVYDEDNTPKGYDYSWDKLLEIKETSKPDIEGFVVLTDKGEFVKVKVNSYVDLHHLKDSVNNLKSLTNIILDDNVDDLIGSFRDDPKTVEYIEEKQTQIGHLYNHIVDEVEKYVQENKELSRKDFAIKTQKLYKNRMGLIMDKYLGKEPKYKDYFMKHKLWEVLSE